MSDDPKRKIRVDKREGPKRAAVLWRFIGYDPDGQKMIFENALTMERRAYYGTTWMQAPEADGTKIRADFSSTGKEYEIEYLDPPEPIPSHHADTCGCNNCKYHRYIHARLEGEVPEEMESEEPFLGFEALSILLDKVDTVSIFKSDPEGSYRLKFLIDGNPYWEAHFNLLGLIRKARETAERVREMQLGPESRPIRNLRRGP